MKTAHPSALLSPEMIKTIRDSAYAAERLGKIHPDQLAIVYEQNWFKLLVPAVYSGLEKSLPELVRLEESISWANGSLGWVVTLCCGAGWFGGFIAEEKAAEIFGLKEVCLAGSGAATGEAIITPNGYKITGKWKYASGAHHATHFTANCIIKNGEENMLNEDGSPLILPFIFDSSKVNILPAWKYTGMVATGSDAFEVRDIEVNTLNSFKITPNASIVKTPLYQYPFLQLAEATLAANISGMAIHFMDLCKAIFAEKQELEKLSLLQKNLLKELLTKVENDITKTRKAFYRAVDQSWVTLKAGSVTDSKTMDAVSKTSRRLAKTARECVDQLYPYCGLIAANTESEINQVWRDIHTASQHSLLTFL
ncbi:acyl-CoA dehydrogenase [Mucilaginibacter sp.]|uniref:acyl-CoA dehydrogenase n=1 Tax=Mucilaginibacter sp. TaxID=1882438 RepID=UPI00283BB20E|nr:acyl-CoA dehydrogenase [Mucilaginibacter sp.]MDR3697762.1 acyl-CoA dehydrogenase [Mucilaginibacter sp.]